MAPTAALPPPNRAHAAPHRPAGLRAWGALPLLALAGSAWAQDGSGAASAGRSLSVNASIGGALTYSDVERPGGGGGSSSGAGTAGTDLAVQVSPSLQVISRSGRVQGSLSYTPTLVQHTRQGEASEVQHALSALFTAEAVPNWAYIDASAGISKRALSPFGTQVVDASSRIDQNQAEVATASVSPSVRGGLGGVATYEARLVAAGTNARHSIVGDSASTTGSLSVNSAGGRSIFGWGLALQRQKSEFRAGRDTETDRGTVSLTVAPDPELNFVLRGGKESTNVNSADKQDHDNWGADARWTPSERTLVSASTDRRYFGQSHAFTLSYRTPLSTLRFTSTRDASTTSNPNGVGQPVTLYQLYFSQASHITDLNLRDQFVLALLQALGQDRNDIAPGGFITSGVTLQRRQDLGWTYGGRRATLALQAFVSESEVIDALQPTAGQGAVRQHGYTVSAGYKLTPTAATTLTGSRLKTMATPTQGSTDLKSLSLALTDRLGRRTTGALSARYSVFNSATEPYRETALTASLNVRF